VQLLCGRAAGDGHRAEGSEPFSNCGPHILSQFMNTLIAPLIPAGQSLYYANAVPLRGKTNQEANSVPVISLYGASLFIESIELVEPAFDLRVTWGTTYVHVR